METEKNIQNNQKRNGNFILTPASDIYETKDEYLMKMEMPGVSRENISITVDNNELAVEGRIDETVPGNDKLKFAEYSLHNYRRVFTVGDDIDRSKIDAVLENGILTLKLHKAEEAKPKKIEVKVS